MSTGRPRATARLQACAIGQSLSVSEVAHAVVDERLQAAVDGEWTWTVGRDRP